ncbi:hypothetical protein [Anaeromicropila herbilytica]|uniref:Immunity protein 30 domain-containing protein n=1 Tax=Anaeromicropila herbilytica TaxID=2785025 RepID=A0A7R7IE82_9FIRM|nr:hypothetical protein [Anaeromicropila herbilytica]BCN32362.1 hypothetical protein bsdtb5_36570 [Anaeromicropila herbilytica]
MDEEYDYILSKSKEELIQIIEENYDWDATTLAMIKLCNIDEKKTLELGIDLLARNEGDEYFQATIFDVIYDVDFSRVLDCIMDRGDNIETVLLGDIMDKMFIDGERQIHSDSISNYLDYIMKQYNLLEPNEKKRISKYYDKFIKEFKITNE